MVVGVAEKREKGMKLERTICVNICINNAVL